MDGVEVRRGEGAKVDGNTAASDLLLICQNILKCESDVTKAEMNRTALIGPFDREASEATEAQRAASSARRRGRETPQWYASSSTTALGPDDGIGGRAAARKV